MPADFPAEGSANANKFLGFDANGDYTAKDAPSGGGGAEKFVVTLTQDEQTEEWTAADGVTIADIVAADEAGKNVVAFFQYMGQLPVELPKVSWIHDSEGTSSLFIFSGIIYRESEEVAFIVGQQDGGSDAWQVTFTPIPTPSNAPLIVTLTLDNGSYVGDATYSMVKTAMDAGRSVVLKASNVPEMGDFTASVMSCTSYGESDSLVYVLFFLLGTEVTSINGAANADVTITVN